MIFTCFNSAAKSSMHKGENSYHNQDWLFSFQANIPEYTDRKYLKLVQRPHLLPIIIDHYLGLIM